MAVAIWTEFSSEVYESWLFWSGGGGRGKYGGRNPDGVFFRCV
jgi:hypothetical protein